MMVSRTDPPGRPGKRPPDEPPGAGGRTGGHEVPRNEGPPGVDRPGLGRRETPPEDPPGGKQGMERRHDPPAPPPAAPPPRGGVPARPPQESSGTIRRDPPEDPHERSGPIPERPPSQPPEGGRRTMDRHDPPTRPPQTPPEAHPPAQRHLPGQWPGPPPSPASPGEEFPPPGVKISLSRWRWTPREECRAIWAEYRRRQASAAAPPPPPSLDRPPPGSRIPLDRWRVMDPEQRADVWARHNTHLQWGVPPGATVVNEELLRFLAADERGRGIVTVQDLINEYGDGTAFVAKCRELGLKPAEILLFRSFPLWSLAVLPPPASGRAPATREEANTFFITQYQGPYNPNSPNTSSSNCGPTSLAMIMKILGTMPRGLIGEQAVDYARALMLPGLRATRGTSITTTSGETVWLLDIDSGADSYINMDEMLTGARDGGMPGASHQTGWVAFEAALNAGQPVVLEGNISADWRAVFADHQTESPGTYQSGGDGHWIAVLGKAPDGRYLVADPMYSGGAVAMTQAELAQFLARQASPDPSFLAPSGGEGSGS